MQLLPALRRLLVAWKSVAAHPAGSLVVRTATGGHVEERNLRRALDDAKAEPR